MKKHHAYLFTIFAGIIGGLDATFKYLAIKRLPMDGGRLSYPIDFALHKNPGIAFDIPVPLSLVIAFTILVSILLFEYARRVWITNPIRANAALVVIIGASGNMIDRILNNFTTDYIILFAKSAINLSDILILLGAILLIYYTDNKDAK